MDVKMLNENSPSTMGLGDLGEDSAARVYTFCSLMRNKRCAASKNRRRGPAAPRCHKHARVGGWVWGRCLAANKKRKGTKRKRTWGNGKHHIRKHSLRQHAVTALDNLRHRQAPLCDGGGIHTEAGCVMQRFSEQG